MFHSRRFVVAAVTTVALSLGLASPAEAAGSQWLVGSQYAAGYEDGWHKSRYATDMALDVLVKHSGTILRCAPSAFTWVLPGIGPMKTLSYVVSGRVKALGRTLQQQTLTQRVGTMAQHIPARGGCAAARQVVQSAVLIFAVGRRASHVYYADYSTYRGTGIVNGVCTIDIRVSQSGYLPARHYAQYRVCGPTW
ncbi:hypothetical protein AB0J83_16690 [Actinoplanes sp. NPDC049596]|uniref:hypothetical protein n=1 Tax=unclassified Actinoplanes TaxID=2626549 RepID=UPI003441C717